MHYRRVYVEGGSYFFTVVTEKRRKIFADDDNVTRLRNAFKTVMKKRPFVIDAAVVLPEHLHFIWTLPEHDSDYSTRWRLIKSAFTKQFPEPFIVQNENNWGQRIIGVRVKLNVQTPKPYCVAKFVGRVSEA